MHDIAFPKKIYMFTHLYTKQGTNKQIKYLYNSLRCAKYQMDS